MLLFVTVVAAVAVLAYVYHRNVNAKLDVLEAKVAAEIKALEGKAKNIVTDVEDLWAAPATANGVSGVVNTANSGPALMS